MLLDNLTNDEGLKKNAFDIDALVSELMEFSIYWFVEELENTDE